MSIAIVGSIVWDVSGFAGRLPAPGETLLGDRYVAGLGGKGANQAVAARKLGAEARFFGMVGRDDLARSARRALEAHGVDAGDLMETDAAATALALIMVDGRGQNAIMMIPSANRAFSPEDLATAAPAIRAAKATLLQFEIPLETTLAAARISRQSGGLTILDPAPAPQDGVPGSVFMAVDIVTPNEVEAAAYCGFPPSDVESGKAAARRLVELGAPAAIVTMGAAGAAWAREDETDGFQPPFKVEAVDSVAAGDCFNGALAVALLEDQDFAAAVRFASAAGALATTRPGASAAAPTRREIETLLQSDKDR